MQSPADARQPYTIHCDESWTNENLRTPRQYFVFHGLMVREDCGTEVLQAIADFKTRRGLGWEGNWVEVKWDKAEREAEEAKMTGKKNRYEQFLDIFFDYLKRHVVSFGCMYLPLCEYKHVKEEYCQSMGSVHDYFFMLYFQFLYHCLVKHQSHRSSFEIFIDNRDLGPTGARYSPAKLATILNKKSYLSIAPKSQPPLSPEMRRQLLDLVQSVTLVESKDDPLIQLSDLGAGCIRYVLENSVPPPRRTAQLGLFDGDESPAVPTRCGRYELAMYFYRGLQAMEGYHSIDLLKPSWHHRVNMFPFQFR